MSCSPCRNISSIVVISLVNKPMSKSSHKYWEDDSRARE
jgi:hypothetical protein